MYGKAFSEIRNGDTNPLRAVVKTIDTERNIETISVFTIMHCQLPLNVNISAVRFLTIFISKTEICVGSERASVVKRIRRLTFILCSVK